MNTLILTNEEAELFKSYMKHHDLFLTMELTGVFDIQYGKAVLNFSQGILQNIQKDETVWRR